MGNTDRRNREWLLILGLLVFAFALLSKWNKWPAGTILLIVSAIISWAGALVQRYRRGHGMAGILGMAAALCNTYVVFRLLYWPGAVIVGVSTLVFTAWAVLLWWHHGRSPSTPLAAAGIVLICTIGLMAVPVHAVYHYMFFETPGAQRFMHSGVGHWYRYSWFLYQDGQHARSATMIDSAMAEVVRHHARTGNDGEWLLVQLRETRSKIEAQDWGEFEQLHTPDEKPR